MSLFRPIGAYTFTMVDQERFAVQSGDRNPLHLDSLRARRTIAGSPVVHGINSLLWALETLATMPRTRPIRAVKAEFPKFLTVQRAVTLWMREDDATTRLEIRADSLLLMKAVVSHAEVKGGGFTSHEPIEKPAEARNLTFQEAARSSGNVALEAAPQQWPNLLKQIGTGGISGMLALTYLVGMVTPGLHSTFSHVDIIFGSFQSAPDRLAFRVTDAREGMPIDIAVSAPAIMGLIRAYYRPPPVEQPTPEALSHLVVQDEFKHISALIVGGSRGLGELTAKLLAAGGAKVVITYAVGREDAVKVCTAITAAGGRCSVIELDVKQSLAPQLALLPFDPDQIYYFATPKISQQKDTVFNEEVFQTFSRFYLGAFHELCISLRGRVTIFYPSSVFVVERPVGLTEYVMTKAAGEVLAAEIDRRYSSINIIIDRLPRMLTDQTAGISITDMPSAPEVMLSSVRKLGLAPR